MELYNDQYDALKQQIDALLRSHQNIAEVETRKGPILAKNKPYVNFLASSTGVSADQVVSTCHELASDKSFFSEMAPSLNELAGHNAEGLETGEIRIHSYTLYTLVRLLKPKVMVETGVANGKSSSFILNAMRRNGIGKLYSIDKPEFEGQEVFFNNAEALVPRTLQSGWMVPQSLRPLWNLQLGDAKELLGPLKEKVGPIDIFFHDSLHSYEHMTFELELAAPWVVPGGLIICDDIGYCEAFAHFTSKRKNPSFAFGSMGTALV